MARRATIAVLLVPLFRSCAIFLSSNSDHLIETYYRSLFSFNKHAGSIILQKLLAVSKLITDEAVLCQFGAEANYGFVLHDKLKQGFAQRFL